LSILVEDVSDVGKRLKGKAQKHTELDRISAEDAAAVKVFGALFVDVDFNRGTIELEDGKALALLSDFDRSAFCCMPIESADSPHLREERGLLIRAIQESLPSQLFIKVVDRFLDAEQKLLNKIESSAVDDGVRQFAKRYIADGLRDLSYAKAEALEC
jgi:hypothetical protein